MKVEKGEWYFSVQCKKCDTIIYFSHDPSRGMAEIAAHEDTHINLTCPACNHVEEYDRNDLVSQEAKEAQI